MTDREEGGRGEDEDDRSNNFPQLNDGGNNNDNSNDNSNSSSSASIPSPSPSSSSPSSPSSSLTTSQAVMINEIELNPTGEYDEGKEWIELYNPSDKDINISNFEISTSSESATIKLPLDAIIEAGETYVIELEEQILSNTLDSLSLQMQQAILTIEHLRLSIGVTMTVLGKGFLMVIMSGSL